jgi:hypothetical protein
MWTDLAANAVPSDMDVVLHSENKSDPVKELAHLGRCRKLITKELVESLAVEKYRANRNGITIEDLETKFLVK